MQTRAVIMQGPRDLAFDDLALKAPAPSDAVVEISYSAISTGTEKLFWTGDMPPFPGMGYPLVPGYEAFGEVVQAPASASLCIGDHVFIPGANCFKNAFGLFGGSAQYIVTPSERLVKLDKGIGSEGALLALAATARHAMAGLQNKVPDLIVGHGVLGRLLARLTIAAGAPAPVVWEVDPARRLGATGYEVTGPDLDQRRDYKSVYDASGNGSVLNELISRIAKGGEIVLAGFYTDPLNFAFPPAFMKEARIRVSAEWQKEDMIATRALIENGALSLGGLITHQMSAKEAGRAYPTAFDDPTCLKMMLNWKDVA